VVGLKHPHFSSLDETHGYWYSKAMVLLESNNKCCIEILKVTNNLRLVRSCPTKWLGE